GDHDLVNEEVQVLTQESTDRGKRKQTEGSGSASASGKTKAKTQRTLPTRSGVWAYYTRLDEDRDKCFCNYCRKEFTCPTKSGITNLRNHMQSCKEFKAWEDFQDPTQKVINKEGHLQTAKVSEPVFREAVNEMLVIGELPLVFVESLAFKHFCNKVNLYKPHSRRTVTRDIVKMYVDKKAALRQ
ncbi:hypothetical protein AALP_AAs40661U000100, partial [Arabis alpina]